MQLIESMDEVIKISDRKHPAWDKAKSAIAKLKQFASQPPAMTAQMKELFMTWLTGIIELDDAKARLIIEYVENYFASQPPAPVGKLWEEVDAVKEPPRDFAPIDDYSIDLPVILQDGKCKIGYFDFINKKWFGDNAEDCISPVSYLRPVTSSFQGGYSLEQMEAAYQAGGNRSWGETYNEFHPEDQVEIKSPTFEQFIQSLHLKNK